MSIKVVFLGAIMVVSVLAGLDKELFKEMGMKCLASTGAELENVKKFLTLQDFETNDELKCFFKCFMAERGEIDSKGALNKEMLNKNIPAQMTSKIDGCSEDWGEGDTCDKAFNFHQCIHGKA